MRHFRTTSGPFAERPFFKQQEIERMCEEELRNQSLLPSSPEPVRIERFVEKRFNLSPTYEALPDAVLGYTKFGKEGVEAIVISRALDEEGGRIAERRVRTTLSHEAGHGLLHMHLFALGTKPLLLFEGETSDAPEILCRDFPDSGRPQRSYDGRWWEHQANLVMGSLLLPRRLVIEAAQPFLTEAGTLGKADLDQMRKEEASRALAEIFDVNPVVVRIRLQKLFPESDGRQLEF